MAKRAKKRQLIHKLPRSISGESKKTRISPIVAGVLAATCIYAFFFIQNTQNPNNLQIERQKKIVDEYHYLETQAKPTPNPSVPPADFQLKIPIIMYHYVEVVKDTNDKMRISLDIVPSTFEYQLKMIQKNGYTTYFVKELANSLDGYKQLDKKSILLTFDDGYEDFYQNVLPLLKKYSMKATFYVVNNLVDTKGYVTTVQLKEITASGLVEIGAHTLDHVYLKGRSRQAQEKEIIKSKVGLEDLLGIRVDTFAYPFGAFDETSIQVVKDAGFLAAVSVIPGNVHSVNEKYYLYRIRAGGFQGPHMFDTIEKDFKE